MTEPVSGVVKRYRNVPEEQCYLLSIFKRYLKHLSLVFIQRFHCSTMCMEGYKVHQWWKWPMNHNPGNVLKILKLPPHTTERCIFEQVWPKPATFKLPIFKQKSGIQDQSGTLSSLDEQTETAKHNMPNGSVKQGSHFSLRNNFQCFSMAISRMNGNFPGQNVQFSRGVS